MPAMRDDLNTWSNFLHDAYDSTTLLENETPLTKGRWRAVADAVLAITAADRKIIEKAIVWRDVTKRLSHAPESSQREEVNTDLIDAVDASGR
jgi:hypothetical protein